MVRIWRFRSKIWKELRVQEGRESNLLTVFGKLVFEMLFDKRVIQPMYDPILDLLGLTDSYEFS
jgi:hypothetical protein